MPDITREEQSNPVRLLVSHATGANVVVDADRTIRLQARLACPPSPCPSGSFLQQLCTAAELALNFDEVFLALIQNDQHRAHTSVLRPRNENIPP